MEKSLDSILEDIKDFKILICNTDEYKEYKENLNIIEKNNEINNLVTKIKQYQKDIVNKENKNIDVTDLNNELDDLYEELYSIKEYDNYINSCKKLNELITGIQKDFNKYFDSLVS